MVMKITIGLIIWLLIVGAYFIFNYGAHMNDDVLDSDTKKKEPNE
jgi:hypothetical protein